MYKYKYNSIGIILGAASEYIYKYENREVPRSMATNMNILFYMNNIRRRLSGRAINMKIEGWLGV